MGRDLNRKVLGIIGLGRIGYEVAVRARDFNMKILYYDVEPKREAEEAFRDADFIVLPTGSMEQHSSHLPLSTDSIRAEELTRYLALHSEGLRMVVLPTLSTASPSTTPTSPGP